MLTRLLAFRHEKTGTSAIEFGLVLPVLLLYMAGIVEFGRAYQTYSAVNRLAARYAMTWADCSGTAATCATEMLTYTTTAAEQNMVPQLSPASGISLRMMQVDMSSSGTASVSCSACAYPSGATPTTAELTVANNAIPNSDTGVIVTVSYTYTPMFMTMTKYLGVSKTFTYTVAQLKK